MPLDSPSTTPQSITQEYAPTDFLSPDQRLDAIADILGTIALRIVKKSPIQQRHEHNQI